MSIGSGRPGSFGKAAWLLRGTLARMALPAARRSLIDGRLAAKLSASAPGSLAAIMRSNDWSMSCRDAERTMTIASQCQPMLLLAGFANARGLPRTVEDWLLAPVGTQVKREVGSGRGQPVALFVLAGRFCAGIKRERAIGIALQGLVLCAERVAFERVRIEEVMLIVERQRPEAVDRRVLARCECDLVVAVAVERGAGRIAVGVVVLRLGRLVVEHVRLGRAGAIEVVDPGLGIVGRAIPAVAGRSSVVLPLVERIDDAMLGLGGELQQRLLDRGIGSRGGEQGAELAIERFLAGQRRHDVEHGAELVEELLRQHPLGLAAASRLGARDRRRLGPVLGLHFAVEVLQRIGDD